MLAELVRPSWWRAQIAQHTGRAFDRRFGVDTIARVAVDDLALPEEAKAHAVHYEPSALPKLRRAIRHLGIDPRGYHFVDVGSGKGLVVFEAARLPFLQVTGIELSPEVHTIAEANLNAMRTRVSFRSPVELLLMDALDYPFSMSRAVVYLYNPFDASVLLRLLEKLTRRLRVDTEDVVLVYVNPLHLTMIRREFEVETVYEHRALVILRLLAPAGGTIRFGGDIRDPA